MKVLQNTRGFTLIELIASMAILAMLVTAFVGLFGNSFAGVFSAGNRDVAISYASEVMELLYRQQEQEPGLVGSEEDVKDITEDFIEAVLGTQSSGFTMKPIVEKVESTNHEDETLFTGYRITLEVQYNGAEKVTTLTSFFRQGE